MLDDAQRWNQKYRAGAGTQPGTCHPLLLEHRALLQARGDALDVACGRGQNARYLAECGNRVVAVDISVVALRECRRLAQRAALPITLLAADLDYFHPRRAAFDLIVVLRYLNRPLIPRLKQALRPRGVLVYSTFNTNHLLESPGFNPAFVLSPGELGAAFADFETYATNDTASNREATSLWVGLKPG